MITDKIKNYKFLFSGIVIFFILLHIGGLNIPYHQDEYKWIYYSHTEITVPGTIPHPPLTEFVYTRLGPLVGDDNFRAIPFVFGLVNLFLIFYLAKIISGNRAALWTAFLFTISFYSLLASLMVDVDGAVMPFFFLIMFISYFELKKRSFKIQISNFKSLTWLVLLVIGATGGFLVKVSGILPIFAVFLDFLIEKGVFSDKKRIVKYLGFGVLGATGLIAILFLAKYIFPFFNLEYSARYWEHFWNSSSFLDRGWLQTFIQFAKSILYTSPLLLLPVFFVDKKIWRKIRPFFLSIFIGLFFYLFAFDFSIGALDRYFQFLIIPLCIISGAAFAKYMNYELRMANCAKKTEIIIFAIISVLIFSIQFFNHYTPPLYPKTEWISRIISLEWNFLYPFMGGSGPLPFYISFGFMALIWIYSLALVIPSFIKNNFKKQALIGVLILGIIYNAVFIEEYLFGKINGNAKTLVINSVSFIARDESIKKIAVYNDNGGYNVRQTNKYEKRIYAAPQFESTYKEFFKNFKGHILFIDIPKIGANSMYAKYFSSCKIIYRKTDKKIEATIYDCQNSSLPKT